MSAFSPGDIIINECVISGSFGSGGVDISRRVKDFEIFENLQKPYSSVRMTVIDNTGMIDRNAIMDGTNTLSLSFQNPGQAPYTNTWTITSAEKSQHTQNLRTKIYTITGYSMHMLRLPRVQKSYQFIPPTGVISDLVNTFLQPFKGFQVRDPARGMIGNQLMPFTINGQQIFKAIRNVMNQAASTSNDSSAYVMFEDKNALVLDTLEHILDTGLSSSVATYIQRPLGQNFLRDQAIQSFVILNLKEDTRVDRTSQVQAESQATRVFDLFGQNFSSALADFGFGGGSSSSTYHNIPYNILRPPNFAKLVASKRQWIASIFDGQSVTITVPFNSDLTVACGYTVQSITPSGDVDLATLDGISGPLVATEVCHNVRLDRKKMMGVSIVRGITGKA